MFDYEYLFAMTLLHAKLKEKIVGRIFVTVTQDDELYVKIESFGGLTFNWKIEDFSIRIRNGYSSDYAAYEVIQQYKRYIIKTYLK